MLLRISVQLILQYLTLLVCLAGVITLQRLHYFEEINSEETAEYFKEEKSLKMLLDVQKKMPSFGFDNLIADWTFLRFIQYFGDGKARKQTGHSLVPDYFETMLNYDPRFIKAYLMVSTANSIFAGKPEQTVSFMEEVVNSIPVDSISTEVFPYAYFIWTYKGIDEMLFLGDTKAAQYSYEKAAQWASLRGDSIGETVAARARETAQFLATNPDSKRAQIAGWITILNNAPDQKTQQYAIEQIKALGAQITITPQGRVQIELPESD
ncbi:MAG: hypothetical protein AB4426_07920 [Xenococcaceae cyanobacterium]